MGSHSGDSSDEPLTPAGRLFLQRDMNTIVHCAVGLKHRIDVAKLKEAIMGSIMVQHPRFHSLLVRDRRGLEHWRRTRIDIDRHVVVVNDSASTSVNDYVSDLSFSSPLSEDKPLWEIHILEEHRCAVFRIHHALGDGISLVSMLLAGCRRADDPEALPTLSGGAKKRMEGVGRNSRWGLLVEIVKVVLFSLVYVFEFFVRALWVRDRKTAISGGAGVELWPRKLATASFLIDDMKAVKKAIAGATINDVLFGVVSCGLSRYLDQKSPDALREGLRITGLAMVNIRKQSGLQELSKLMKGDSGTRWGNKFGMLLLPIYYHRRGAGNADPIACLKRAKTMIDRKKLSIEAYFSYTIGYFVMSWLGAKVACILNYRIICNTTFTISNVVGPREEITLADNPVTYLRANTSSLPHALTMHMVSYAGKADMQILVAKDIIPDPDFLAKCFEDSLLEMKEAALDSKIT